MWVSVDHGPPAEVLRQLAQLAHCCLGAAENGPGSCSCWEPEYDLEQSAELRTDLEPVNATVMCGDCAYRPDSPERTGDPRYSQPPGTAHPFWCHAGMRKPLRWRHPAGITVEATTDGYEPPIRDGIPYRADGTPGARCAGWTARAEVARLRDLQEARANEDSDTVGVALWQIEDQAGAR